MKRRSAVKSYRTTPATCPTCGKLNNAVTCLGDYPPRAAHAGDVTICAGCAVYLVFTETMGLRCLKDSEWMTMSVEDRAAYSLVRDRIKLTMGHDEPPKGKPGSRENVDQDALDKFTRAELAQQLVDRDRSGDDE